MKETAAAEHSLETLLLKRDSKVDVEFELIGKKLSNIQINENLVPTSDTDFLGNSASLLQALASAVPEYQLNAMHRLKDFLCTNTDIDARADFVVSRGFLAHFSDCLAPGKPAELHYETCWAITNIAAANSANTRSVVPFLSLLVDLLQSDAPNVRTQACWAIGNIAGDCQELRDIVIQTNCIPSIIYCATNGLTSFHDDQRRTMALHVAAWTIGNLCRYKNFDWSKHAYPFIHDLLLTRNDQELISECCWALQRIFNDRNLKTETLVHPALCQRLIELLKRDNMCITTPILKAITNILSTDDDEPTQAGILPELGRLLRHGPPNVRLETLYVLSNMAAGTSLHIQSLIDNGFVSMAIEILNDPEEKRLRREACWILSNTVKGSLYSQVKEIASRGALEALINFVVQTIQSEDQIHYKAVDCIHDFLKIGSNHHPNIYVEWFKQDENAFTRLYEAFDHLRKKELFSDWSRRSLDALDTIIKTWFAQEANRIESTKLGFSHMLQEMENIRI